MARARKSSFLDDANDEKPFTEIEARMMARSGDNSALEALEAWALRSVERKRLRHAEVAAAISAPVRQDYGPAKHRTKSKPGKIS